MRILLISSNASAEVAVCVCKSTSARSSLNAKRRQPGPVFWRRMAPYYQFEIGWTSGQERAKLLSPEEEDEVTQLGNDLMSNPFLFRC